MKMVSEGSIDWKSLEEDTLKLLDLAVKISKFYDEKGKKISSELILETMLRMIG